MTKNTLNAAFHPMKPDAQQKQRMLLLGVGLHGMKPDAQQKQRMLAAIRSAAQPQPLRGRRCLV